jgi:hypothetical protein
MEISSGAVLPGTESQGHTRISIEFLQRRGGRCVQGIVGVVALAFDSACNSSHEPHARNRSEVAILFRPKPEDSGWATIRPQSIEPTPNHRAASFIQPVAPLPAPSVPPDVPESTEQIAQPGPGVPGLQ